MRRADEGGGTPSDAWMAIEGGAAHVVWMEGSDVVYRRGSAQIAFSGATAIEPDEPELVGLTSRVDGRLDKDHSVLWVSQRASGTDVWYYSFRPYRVN